MNSFNARQTQISLDQIEQLKKASPTIEVGAVKMKTKDQILVILKEKNDWMTPTELGLKMGKPYNNASSFTSHHLRKLDQEGKVERNKSGHAKVK